MVQLELVNTEGFTKKFESQTAYDNFDKYGVAMNVNYLKKSVTINEANQGSAAKLIKVAPCENHYADAVSGTPATTNWNIFRCSFMPEKWNDNKDVYNLTVLEQHPYSTQTFIPMGRDADEDAYIVNVAPDLNGRPDYENIESFVFKGNTAVTYNTKTWHSPMIVLGKTTDFCVLTNENGIPEEDCLEVFYTPGFDVCLTKQ